MNAACVVSGDVLCKLTAKDEAFDEAYPQNAVHLAELPPAGFGEVDLNVVRVKHDRASHKNLMNGLMGSTKQGVGIPVSFAACGNLTGKTRETLDRSLRFFMGWPPHGCNDSGDWVKTTGQNLARFWRENLRPRAVLRLFEYRKP